MYLTAEQIGLLMQPAHPGRVLYLDGASHLAAWDIRAMLIRVFGFGCWSDEALQPTRLVFEAETTTKNGKPAYTVAYQAHRRLIIMDPDGNELAHYDATAISQQTMPDYKRGDAHDFAARTAESTALKRAATNLGSQMGLSLYNGGSQAEVVRVLANDPRRSAATTMPDATDAMPEVTHDDDLAATDEEAHGA